MVNWILPWWRLIACCHRHFLPLPGYDIHGRQVDLSNFCPLYHQYCSSLNNPILFLTNTRAFSLELFLVFFRLFFWEQETWIPARQIWRRFVATKDLFRLKTNCYSNPFFRLRCAPLLFLSWWMREMSKLRLLLSSPLPFLWWTIAIFAISHCHYFD